jgi:hypothetical protein
LISRAPKEHTANIHCCTHTTTVHTYAPAWPPSRAPVLATYQLSLTTGPHNRRSWQLFLLLQWSSFQTYVPVTVVGTLLQVHSTTSALYYKCNYKCTLPQVHSAASALYYKCNYKCTLLQVHYTTSALYYKCTLLQHTFEMAHAPLTP